MQRLESLLYTGALRHPSRTFLLGTSNWTYGTANEEVDRRTGWFRHESRGLPVLLCGENSPIWIINLLALLRAGIPAILVPNGMPPTETETLVRTSGAPFAVEEDAWRSSQVPAESVAEWFKEDAAVGFVTSGSTGTPRVALRSHGSLMDEGARYQELWRATENDIFFALAPLYHAYTFGAALCAALSAGATLAVSQFKSPHRASDEIIRTGATILPVVPAIARMLALVDQGRPVRSALRIAMSGAGPTSDSVSAAFSLRWGVSLSRNYGSSETGAVLAKLAPVCGDVTGSPMPNVACELVRTQSGQAQLWVQQSFPPIGHITSSGFEPARLSPGGWWPMGDLFERSDDGALRIVGRLGSVIRRGGRSLYPKEIEAALLSNPAVQEAYVKGCVEPNGEELIEAHVGIGQADSVRIEELQAFLQSKLAPYKLPNRWRLYEELPKTWSQKTSPRLLGVADKKAQPNLMEAVQGFRLSQAIFAAEQIGLFQTLAIRERSLGELSQELKCDPPALALFLDFLECAGLVQSTGVSYRLVPKVNLQWPAICRFERELNSSWLSAEEIQSVLRSGVLNRRFERSQDLSKFSQLYCEAFSGSWQRLVSRKLQGKLQLTPGAKVLELGRAAGQITAEFRASYSVDCSYIGIEPGPGVAWRELPREERMRTSSWQALPLQPASLDAVVLTNCVHWLDGEEAPVVLKRIAGALRPNGALIIVDLFVDASNNSWHYLLDWLTHGGVYWTKLNSLQFLLQNLGFHHVDIASLSESPIRLLTCYRSPEIDEFTQTERSEAKYD